MENCTICGKDLPNRYAVAGRCEEAGCNCAFCSLHWRRSNHRCREHGYQEAASDRVSSPVPHAGAEPEHESERETEQRKETMTEPEDKSAAPPQPAGQAVSAANAKSAMKEALRLVKKMGIGAASLLKRLKKDRSPQAMLNTLEESVGTNRQQREEASARVERLFREIAEKKKAFAAAPKARQRILEKELRSRLAEYKAAERQLDVYLENERVLSTVKGRLGEIMAYGMRGISEIAIDDITDEIEDKVAEAEAVADATRDLEKAGRRRERESDKEDLWAELGEFDGEAAASSLDKELAGFDAEETPKRKEPKTPAEPEKESTD